MTSKVTDDTKKRNTIRRTIRPCERLVIEVTGRVVVSVRVPETAKVRVVRVDSTRERE